MNALKVARSLIHIASRIKSVYIARKLIQSAKEVITFDMTEREWEEYHKKHPHAEKSNHHIIKVEGKPHHESDYKEYMVREKAAKKKYFREMKKKHPNYVPIVKKDDIQKTLTQGEYTIISAGVNPNMPEDVENAKKDKDFIKNRTESLKKDLDKLGVKYTEIAGSYGGEEPSFLISHTMKAKVGQKKHDNSYFVKRNEYGNPSMIKKLNNLGKKYNQDSVAHGSKGRMEWHFTTGENAGLRVKGRETEFKNGAEDFYSEARIGDSDYTMWACDMSPAWEDKEKNYVDNPYFEK